LLGPRTAIPLHSEGWKHVREREEDPRRVLGAAPAGVRERIRWLPLGEPVDVDV
jgi:hypothetical protein